MDGKTNCEQDNQVRHHDWIFLDEVMSDEFGSFWKDDAGAVRRPRAAGMKSTEIQQWAKTMKSAAAAAVTAATAVIHMDSH